MKSKIRQKNSVLIVLIGLIILIALFFIIHFVMRTKENIFASTKNESDILKQQCIWGTWKIEKQMLGGEGWQDCIDNNREIYMEFYPESFSFGDEKIEISSYASRLMAIKDENTIYHGESVQKLGINGDYLLEIELSYDKEIYKQFTLPFSYIVLMSNTEMLICDGRAMYKAVKIENGRNIIKDNGLLVWENSDICNGNWIIVEILRADKEESVNMHIGEIVETRIEEKIFQSCRVYDCNEKYMEELLQLTGFENNSYMVCYDFSTNFYWDKMIIMDKMSIILVKGKEFYKAERISDVIEDGIYNNTF